jgi:hypothetical protein
MKNILISKIKTKTSTYSFSFPKESETLLESIKKVGVLQPVMLTNSMEIICGLKRVLACKKLRIKEIKTIIIDKKLTGIELFKLNLEESLSVKSPNLIEKSIILNKLQGEFGLTQETIIHEYLPMLEIPANIKYLNNYMWINNLSDKIKKIIIEKNISIDTLNSIKNWPKKSIDNLFIEILNFNLGNSKTLQIINLLNEISLKNEQSLESPLQLSEWRSFFKNPKIPLFQKGLHLREFLLAKRYPLHTEIKNRLKHYISKLNLPKGVSVMPDIFTLENNFISFKIECKQENDLKRSAQKLAEIADSKTMKELLELLKI